MLGAPYTFVFFFLGGQVYLACDFLEGGSSSFHPHGRARKTFMQVVEPLKKEYDVVFFSPKIDLPEAIESNNHMLIAVRTT